MKHAIIVAHPNTQSFTASAADIYRGAVEALGHVSIVRNLYQCGFDPRLGDGEIPRPPGFAAAEDVLAERALIADADVFAFFYPLWFNAPPAILVGYVQRVFGMGFGYGPIRGGGNEPLLTGKSMISFSSSGAPTEWLRSEGSWEALQNLFDHHVADVCGLRFLDHRHFGGVLSQTPRARVEAYFAEIVSLVQRQFAAQKLHERP